MGCSSVTGPTTEELAAVVARDGIAFEGPVLSPPVLDRLAEHRVLVLGETHHLREHYELTTVLLRDLHSRGFRQLLVEQPQRADWWLDDYVRGGPLQPPWEPPPNRQRKYGSLREFNAGLPPNERIRVRAIDANETYYGGATSFRGLLAGLVGYFPSAGPVDTFLQADYASAPAQIKAIDELAATLEADRATLLASWGQARYEAVVEMVEVERASIDIRVDRVNNDDRAARAREAVIKRLVDARIAGSPDRTVINIGGNHAQKVHLKGTSQEWLGDYLVHRSPAVGGSAFVVAFVSARIDLEPGSSGTPFDGLATSPPNELFRVIAEARPGLNVFLPLDDPIFSKDGIRVNFEETIYVCALKEHYDAVLQYGLAHRVPID
jgi:hypothetical protein